MKNQDTAGFILCNTQYLRHN